MSIWRRYLEWRLRNVYAIMSDREGFAVVNRGRSVRVFWKTVSRIVAFKRDLFSVDLICLLVVGAEASIEVNEEMDGFEQFSSHMTDALNLRAGWWQQVAFPAFAVCETLVFEREAVR